MSEDTDNLRSRLIGMDGAGWDCILSGEAEGLGDACAPVSFGVVGARILIFGAAVWVRPVWFGAADALSFLRRLLPCAAQIEFLSFPMRFVASRFGSQLFVCFFISWPDTSPLCLRLGWRCWRALSFV